MAFFDTTTWKGNKPKTTLPKCGQCGLYKRCQSPKMEVGGRGRVPILFVGEAPGETEDARGKHFVGQAGQWLRKIVGDLGLDLSDAWLTNAAICKPPKGAMDDLYVRSCRPNLINTINELKPKVVVLLGPSAVQSLLGDIKDLDDTDVGAIGTWVGWQIPSLRYNTWICPTYNPSYVLHTKEDRALVKITKEHLQAALLLDGKKVDALSQETWEKRVRVVRDHDEMQERLTKLSQAEGDLTFDYETTGLKPEREGHQIYSASFCLNHGSCFAGRILEEHHPILRKVLRNTNLFKDGCNIKFEERWSRAILGTPVKNWRWDTMIAAHVLDNRPKITSIKFQAFVRLGIVDYSSTIKPYLEAPDSNGFNKIQEAPLDQLLLYNGMDSLLEDEVAVRQQKEFGA